MAHSASLGRVFGVRMLASSAAVIAGMSSCTVPDFVFAPPSAAGSSEATGATGGDDSARGGDGSAGGEPSATGGQTEPGGTSGAGGSAVACEACAGAPTEGGAAGSPPISIDDFPGLIAAYTFEDSSNVFADSSGNEQSGRAGAFDWVGGKRGRALSLDGAYGYVTLPAAGVTDALDDFTVALWVKPKSLASGTRLFDIGTGQTAFVTMLAAAATTQKPRFAMKTVGNGTLYVDSTAGLELDAWQHVSVTQSGNTVTLYIDGTAVGTSSAITYRASSFAANQNYLGRSQFSDPLFDGAFDEFRMYRRALSLAEIKSVASGAAVSNGLLLSYDFDEAEGSTAAETSGSSAKLARAQSGIVYVPGTSGSALELDGASGYVQLPANLLDGISDFTVACFVSQNQVRSAARIFDFGVDGADYITLMATASSQKLRFGARFEGGVEQVLDTVPLTPSTWEHVAVTRSGSVVRVFVGGAEVGSRVVPGLPSPLSTTSNWLGRSHRGDALLNAALDDFRIYDRALSGAEVAALALSGQR